MHAIVLELDNKSSAKIKDIQAQIKEDLGVKYIYDRLVSPHITLIQDLKEIPQDIDDIFINSQGDFPIESNGLGVFYNEQTFTLYLRWKVSESLKHLHQYLYEKVVEVPSIDVEEQKLLFNNWIAKTTLAHKDFGTDNLESILELSKSLNKKFTATVKSICLYEYNETGEYKRQEVFYRK